MTTLIPVVDVPMSVEASAEFAVTASVVRDLYTKLEEAGYDVEPHDMKHTVDSLVHLLWIMTVIPSLRALLLLDPKSEESTIILDQLNAWCVNEKEGQFSANVAPTETVAVLLLLSAEYWENAFAARLLPDWDIVEWRNATLKKIRRSMLPAGLGDSQGHGTFTSECRKLQNAGMSGTLDVRMDLNVDVGKRQMKPYTGAEIMSTVKGRLFLATTQELPLTLRSEVEALFVKHGIEALVLSPSEMNMLHSPLQVFLVETTPNSITVGIHSLSTIPPTAREYIAQRLWEDKQVVEWIDDTAIRVTFPQEYSLQIMQLIEQTIISKVYVSLANMSGNQKLSFDHKAGLSQ